MDEKQEVFSVHGLGERERGYGVWCEDDLMMTMTISWSSPTLSPYPPFPVLFNEVLALMRGVPI